MSDSNETNQESVAKATVNEGVLDMRPSKDGIVYQLLRLGLVYDHAGADGETWCDYRIGLQADFKTRASDSCTLTDMDTKTVVTATVEQLKQATSIKTWRSDGASD